MQFAFVAVSPSSVSNYISYLVRLEPLKQDNRVDWMYATQFEHQCLPSPPDGTTYFEGHKPRAPTDSTIF